MTDRARRDVPTIEAIVAVDPPREFRVHPRDRAVAFTDEVAGARQLFTMSLRGGPAIQVTASEKDVSDPQWSPDGRRLAYVRDDAIWVVEADGSRQATVTEQAAGVSMPRWSPDGRTISFVSRRRGWSQLWLIDAPVPRRGRPASNPKPPTPRAISPTGRDVDDYDWSPDGRSIVTVAKALDDLETSEVHVVDLASGERTRIAGHASLDVAARWVGDGSLLYLTDAEGWFRVLHRSADGGRAQTVAEAEIELGEPGGEFGFRPLPAPDGRRFVHVAIHDGLVDLVLAPLEPVSRGRRSGRRRSEAAGVAINPWPGVWRAVGWLSDGSAIVAIGEGERRPQDLWVLPVEGRRGRPAGPPRQVTVSLPAVLRPAFEGPSFVESERVAITARDGLRLEGTLWRPPSATGRRGGGRVPAIVSPHGGPTWQAYRGWNPFKQLLVREGFALLDIDFRGSTGYGREFRTANQGEWGHADAHDVIDAAHWLRDQPWCDGRLAVYGGSYGGYLVLAALVEEPDLWRAGVDLYGDSEIAESYRHGDRIGRLDLERQMGRPDDPTRADLYRRGSPVYRAERIEAPVLILHGRKDKRVVPLMTERMAEALEIEGKHHEVVWYDDEGHGWKKPETRRDAFTKILAFLRRHVLDAPAGD